MEIQAHSVRAHCDKFSIIYGKADIEAQSFFVSSVTYGIVRMSFVH